MRTFNIISEINVVEFIHLDKILKSLLKRYCVGCCCCLLILFCYRFTDSQGTFISIHVNIQFKQQIVALSHAFSNFKTVFLFSFYSLIFVSLILFISNIFQVCTVAAHGFLILFVDFLHPVCILIV